MKKVFLLVVMLMATFAQALTAANDYGIPDNIQDGNILHCFDWKFTDIQAELPNIAKAGFGAVQVSPVQGNCNVNAEWYWAYMPYDFKFVGCGNGSRSQLQALCTEAKKYGIKIVVDVVANHINAAQSNRDPWWNNNNYWHNNGSVNGDGDRYNITHGNLGDYGDVNSENTDVQQRCKAFIEDLKSLGVAGIRWDAAKHIGLPSEGCNFWKVVCSVPGMWHYGEILNSPGPNGNNIMKEYTQYMSVTDNGYCQNMLNAVNSGNVNSQHGGWAASAIAEDKVVYWGESHDTYSNDGAYGTNTAYVAQDKVDRTWAIMGCRAGATALYFSRPSGTSRNAIKMGQKGSTHYTSKEIAAVNHLRNAAVGTADYYTAQNGVACVTRKGVGACIVIGGGGSRNVSVSNGGGYVPAGTYVDEVSGNRFTVTASTISGQVGSTGIAVIYDSKAASQPYVSFSPAGSSFRAETLRVTATLVNATSGWYKINNGSQVNITSGAAAFNIGEGVDYGNTITISWSATGAEGTQTGSETYTKLDPNAAVYVYYNNPSNWSAVNAYIYHDTAGEAAKWPGSPMAKGANGLWSIEVPEAFIDGGKIIFNNGGDQQFPASNEPGLDINGKSMICQDNYTWREYDGNTGGGNTGGGGGNDNPGTGGGDSSQPGTYVYLRNTHGWNAPTVWAWNDSGNCTTNGGWPGDQMHNVGGDLWKWEAPSGKVPTKIIFSNSGQNKTQDLDYVNKATYDCVGTIVATGGTEGGGNTDPGTGSGSDITLPTGNFLIYFDNTNSNWTTPYIHYWGGDSQTSWPGSKMTKLTDNVWYIDAAPNTTGCLFNAGDGDATKTPDFTAIAGHIYSTSGDLGVYSPTPGTGGGNTDPGPTPEDPVTPQPVEPGTNLNTNYYKVNPNGQVGSNKTINVNVSNMKATNALSNWTERELIAQGVARDVCQAFKGTHERPVVDSYALYAAYDAQNLYLGVQYVYTIWDEWGEGFQAGESKPYNMDGDLMIVFDLDPKKAWDGTLTNGNSVWKDKAYTTFNNGIDAMWHGSTKPGVGTPGLFFPNASGKADYNDPNSCKQSRVVYGYADGVLPSITAIYGQKEFGYDPKALEGNTGFVDLNSEVSRLGGNSSAHTFYEFKFPLSDLGITENYIKTQGIGVMIVDMYGSSAHATLPYDPSMYDNVNEAYSQDPSSSKEKEDLDVVTYAPARIGRLAAGVENVTVDSADQAIIRVVGGILTIEGAEGRNVVVAGVDGRLYFNGVAQSSVALPLHSGVYVVNVGGRSAKVLVK